MLEESEVDHVGEAAPPLRGVADLYGVLKGFCNFITDVAGAGQPESEEAGLELCCDLLHHDYPLDDGVPHRDVHHSESLGGGV